jgi:hypothetical protein
MVNFDYCNKECPVGIKAGRECLADNESVSDAVIDFWYFIEECFKTCPYKDKHNTEENNESLLY